MVPAALGTQTVGSTIRPASYCGAVGFKPSYHALSLAGVKAQAESLDTLGVFARSVADIVLVSGALLGAPEGFTAPARETPPRLAFCRSPHWPKAHASVVEAMDEALRLFRADGAWVEDVDLAPDYERVLDAQWTILSFEFARVLAFERTLRRDDLSERLRDLLDRGSQAPFAEYRAALDLATRCRTEIDPLFERFDAIVTPAAASEAPEGLHAPSDLLFQRLWTVLRLPAITLPGLKGERGLPIGVQLVGRRNADAAFLAVARWAESTLRKVEP
jgi:amidase